MGKKNQRFDLTHEDKKKIQTMVGLGLPLKLIAPVFDVDLRTLQRRIAEDSTLAVMVEKGRALAGRQVAQTAFEMAISGKHPQMTMFWLKCRLNWSETPFEQTDNKTISLVYDASKQASS